MPSASCRLECRAQIAIKTCRLELTEKRIWVSCRDLISRSYLFICLLARGLFLIMRQLSFFLGTFHGSGLGIKPQNARLLNSPVVCAFFRELGECEFRTVACYSRICTPVLWQFLAIWLRNHKNGDKKNPKKRANSFKSAIKRSGHFSPPGPIELPY